MRSRLQRSLAGLIVGLSPLLARADGPADNVATKVRQVPAIGVEIPDSDRKELEEGLAKLSEEIARFRITARPELQRYLPDVRIHEKAVRYALDYREFFVAKEIARGKELLRDGQDRLRSLEKGETPWLAKKGPVVLGYTSKIDDSVQPYVLVIPESYGPGPNRHRLDIWFHGRNEALSEVNLFDERRGDLTLFAPADTFVLHPYGRYCNAFKFAGEVDVFEALDDVKQRFRIDDDRVSVRGFSMGGAATWHFAVHYPDRWFAANPGAGFSETPRFLKIFQNEQLQPAPYEKTLWHLYDCNDWARNLIGCPTVAYSGELDTQKQAADVMEEALAKEGIPLTHIIGAKTKHQYDSASKTIVSGKMDRLAERGRDRNPSEIDFTTFTLRYNTNFWATIDALAEHWKPATIRASIATVHGKTTLVVPRIENITAFHIALPAGSLLTKLGAGEGVALIGGDRIEVPGPASDRSWEASFHLDSGHWKPGPAPETSLRKKPGLQGPIDDAFLDSFVFVKPTGTGKHEKVSAWVKSESTRAVDRWRRQFRGDARIRDDQSLTPAEIASMNLILWGDPESNSVIRQIADKLPIRWDGDSLVVGDRRYSASDHVPILVFPNPLNPARYVVLNSGFTYREYDDLNNARQVPRLPDWAIIDVTTPPNPRFPGKVVAADFFDESWRLKVRND